MATIPKPSFPPPWAELTADFSERLQANYALLKDERRRLFEMAERDIPQADETLHRIEVSFDDVVGAIDSAQRHVSFKRLTELTTILEQSLLNEQHDLIDWLYDQAACPRTADFLERTNDLRLIAIRLFRELLAPTQGKQSA